MLCSWRLALAHVLHAMIKDCIMPARGEIQMLHQLQSPAGAGTLDQGVGTLEVFEEVRHCTLLSCLVCMQCAICLSDYHLGRGVHA